ncbi:MAG: hypothetical protein KGY65_03720 [Candidatus Thermoplasmatota archaeon]|nr:hypothetical protein [Candidatus Thermoplasmatota archaeon]MBS3801838.1 hypothetical protein [Candidatus Thermoplasmatota archaeon]
MSFNYEHELIKPVYTHFASTAEIIFYEVPIGFCRADMIVFQKDNTSIAIELKLADWKKALIQAQNYQLATDFVYLAFPFSKCELVLKRAKEKLRHKGIGLFSVDEETRKVSEVLAAKKSTVLFGRLSKKEIINRKKRVYQRKRL